MILNLLGEHKPIKYTKYDKIILYVVKVKIQRT